MPPGLNAVVNASQSLPPAGGKASIIRFLRRRVRRKKTLYTERVSKGTTAAAREARSAVQPSRKSGLPLFRKNYIHMAKGRRRPPSTRCSRGRCSQSDRVTCRDFSIMPSMSSSRVSRAGAPYSRVPHSKCSWKLR